MPKEIKTEILIHSSPGKVWNVLTDFKSYPDWNPFLKTLEGNVEAGKKIKVRIQPPGGKGMTFKPRVLVFEKEKELRWLGHLLFPGIFDGEHRFQLIDNNNGTTTFIHSEKFKGILVPLMKKMLEVDTKNGFEEMNKKLKVRVEQETPIR
jgi:hypothetical protein